MYHYCEQYKTIYTTGDEKAKLVRMFTTADVVNYSIPKTFALSFRELCTSVKSKKHKTTNCALLKAYILASALSSSLEGGECG
ncbi:hypothetical protein, partial [Klebsiella pneumoniae]|uniref:hypothetical protein n=1 Tax=Klebsiella pneumoniae TaxID=573 RepID=UPI001C8F9DEF